MDGLENEDVSLGKLETKFATLMRDNGGRWVQAACFSGNGHQSRYL
ncbi:hypothetical protein [Pseudalkalibacillus sp. R45]